MPSSSYAINDAEVGHAVQLLTQDDEEHFLRWTDVCDSVFIRDSSNNTLLHWSASLGNLSLTRHLTDLGLDVRARNLHGSTPLHCAAASCRNPGAILEFLISHGASTTEANDVGDTMQSLLERRQLQDLGDLFTLLQTTMDECPKLFASTGRDVEGLTFDVGADLGTAKVLAKMSGSTVRFEKQDVGAMMGSGSGVEELQQHGLRRRSGPMTSSSMQKQQGMESAGSSNIYSPRTCDSSSLNPDPSPSTQVSFDASWIAERERKVLSMEEDADRLRTENEYWVEFSAIAGAAHDAGTLFSCPRRVHAVLGERYGEGGKRFLLIQWEDDDGNPMEDEETWELIPDVSYSPVVGEYIARFEGSYSTMDNVAMTYTTGTTSAQQRVLDSREREELERELDLLPRRVCSISSQSLTTSTPRLMRRGRSNQEFEELCHEEEAAPAQATQDDVVAHEHEPLGNMMRAQIGSRETDDEVCDWLNLQDVKPDWLVAGESVRSDQDDLRAARRFISSMNNSGRVGKWVRVMEEDASPPEAIPSLPVSRSGNDVPVQLPSSSQPLQMRLSSQATASPIRRHAPPVNVPTGILSTPRLCSLEVQSQQAQQAQQAAGQGSSDSSSQDAGPTPLAASAAQAADQPPPPAKSTFLRPSSVARQPNSAARQRVEQQLRSIRSHAHSPPPDIERRDANIRFAEATRFEYEKFLYRSALSILQQRQDVVDGLDL